MSSAGLRLVETDDQDVLSFDRRLATRHVLTGRVTALRRGSTQDPSSTRICAIELKNISDTGIGAVCQDAFDLDTPITIFFPPHGPERGFDVQGRVVRCRDRKEGHEIGIQFQQKNAA